MSNLLSAKYIFKTYFSRQFSIQQKPHSVIPIEKIPKQEFEKKNWEIQSRHGHISSNHLN